MFFSTQPSALRQKQSELQKLINSNFYCSGMAKAAKDCGENWAAKEYQDIIEENDKKIVQLEALINDPLIWQ